MLIFLIILLIILLLIIISFITIYVIVYKKHTKFFEKRIEINPLVKSYTKEDFDLLDTKITINDDKDTIVGYLYNQEKYNNKKLIIFCHGYGVTKEAYIQDVGFLCQNKYQVFLYDSLGVGESSSEIKGFGSYLKSADKVLNYFMTNDLYKNKDIYVVGHSIGGLSAGSLVKKYPNIKGVCLLAPALSIYNIFESRVNKKLISKMITHVDNVKTKYSKISLDDTLSNYSGKVLVIQSDDDNVINTKYVKEKLSNIANITFVGLDRRCHNPEYEEDAVRLYNNFINELKTVNPNDYIEFFNKQDFKAMGTLDKNVMNHIVNFLK